MARQPLAVKYRPKNFEDMTEQSAIKDILTNQINTKTFQHGSSRYRKNNISKNLC